MKDSPSAPAPVDQAALIKAQAEANRTTQYTPLGDLRFGTVGSGGEFVPGTSGTATFVDLPPEYQNLLNLASGTATELGERGLVQAGNLPAEPIDFSGLPGFTSELDFSGLPALPGLDFSGLTPLPGIDDFSADAERARDASFQQAMGLLNPEFDRQQGRLEQTLANRGLPSGGEAYDDEFDRFDDARNRALQSAAFEAVRAGGAEQSRLFGLASVARGQGFQETLAGLDTGFRTRQQMLAEALQGIDLSRTGRQQGIQELTGERSLQFG